MSKKVVMIIAGINFRDEEYKVPRAILEKAGVEIKVASSVTKPCRGVLGMTVTPDMLISEINVGDYEAIIFVGGGGSSEYWNNETALSIARECIKLDKLLCAICIAPVTLANAGVLNGKKATVFSSEIARLKNKGVNYTGRDVEIDGKIITANGPAAAGKFGEAIAKALE
ncbi:MAG: DJ-1/PfpI family protein [bacterium]